MKGKIYFLLLIFITIFAISCGNMQEKAPHSERARPEKAHIGHTHSDGAHLEKARDFTLTDINGDKVTLSDYSGSIILLNFFATWCPPCRVEMPDFSRIQEEYPDDVKIIAVNVDNESHSKVHKFVQDNGINFTVAIDDGRASGLYGPIRGIPVTVIIDRDFNIAKRYLGMRPKEVFVEDIRALL
jgi:thiol-disulfide isomerase/thioredoxin